MKTIRIAFEGFWQEFEYTDNFIYNILRKHYHVQIIDTKFNADAKKNVQYLFCSDFSDEYLDYDCVRIYYTGENIFPNMNAFDYAIGFEHFSLEDRYIRYPLYAANYVSDVERMRDKHYGIDKTYSDRKFCSMVVSNSEIAAPQRREFFELLSNYKRVDSGGKYLNNIGCPEGVADKEAFQKEYKFSIAFENSSNVGYCTEKIVQGFAARTIPIYWGDPLVEGTFNGRAFINCHNFSSFEKVVEYIKKVDGDDNLYLEMLKTPAISEDKLKKEEKELEEWLCHIIDQEYEKAFRRKLYGTYYAIEKGLCNEKHAKKEIKTTEKYLILKRMKGKICKIYKRNSEVKEESNNSIIDYEPNREYQLGNKNPEVIFYVVRRDGGKVGLLSLFNTHIGHIAYALRQGYVPIVDMQNYPNIYLEKEDIGKRNSWEYYFEQPYGRKYSLEEVYQSKRVIFSSLEPIFPRPDDDMDFLMNERAREYWHKIFLKYSALNKKIVKAASEYYEKMFEPCLGRGGRILGVHVRGTDYHVLRPKDHPIQPDIGEAIDEIQKVMDEWKCTDIYLATEDKRISEEMKRVFAGKVMSYSEQNYKYSGRGYINDVDNIGDQYDRYERGKEYLCDIFLLMKCNCFIGGRTSGTVAMHIMGDGFEHKKFWDYGRYGKDDYLEQEI